MTKEFDKCNTNDAPRAIVRNGLLLVVLQVETEIFTMFMFAFVSVLSRTENIITIHRQKLVTTKQLVLETLECLSYISQPKRHVEEFVWAKWRFPEALRCNRDLAIRPYQILLLENPSIQQVTGEIANVWGRVILRYGCIVKCTPLDLVRNHSAFVNFFLLLADIWLDCGLRSPLHSVRIIIV